MDLAKFFLKTDILPRIIGVKVCRLCSNGFFLPRSQIFIQLGKPYEDVRRSINSTVYLYHQDGAKMGLMDAERVRQIAEKLELLVTDLHLSNAAYQSCRLITRSGLKALRDAQKKLEKEVYPNNVKKRDTCIKFLTTIDEQHLRLKAKTAEKYLSQGSRVKVEVSLHRFRKATRIPQVFANFLSFIPKECYSRVIETYNKDQSKLKAEVRSYLETKQKKQKFADRVIFDFVEEKAFPATEVKDGEEVTGVSQTVDEKSPSDTTM